MARRLSRTVLVVAVALAASACDPQPNGPGGTSPAAASPSTYDNTAEVCNSLDQAIDDLDIAFGKLTGAIGFGEHEAARQFATDLNAIRITATYAAAAATDPQVKEAASRFVGALQSLADVATEAVRTGYTNTIFVASNGPALTRAFDAVNQACPDWPPRSREAVTHVGGRIPPHRDHSP